MSQNSLDDQIVLLIVGFNRPELIRSRLKNALDSGVSNVFVSIDFSDDETKDKIIKIVENCTMSWPAGRKIESAFHTKNLGLTRHITETIGNLLKKYPYVMVFEDDISFNRSTVKSLRYGINLMNRNSQIASVGCYSGIPISRKFQIGNRYRLSPYFACWGWATSRSIWEKYNTHIDSKVDMLADRESSTWGQLSDDQRKTWLGRFEKISKNPNHTWDTQFQHMCFRNNFVNLLPIFPIIENVGFDDSRSVHTKDKKPKWMIADNLPNKHIRKYLRVKILLKVLNFMESLTLFGDNQNTLLRLKRLKRLLRKSH